MATAPHSGPVPSRASWPPCAPKPSPKPFSRQALAASAHAKLPRPSEPSTRPPPPPLENPRKASIKDLRGNPEDHQGPGETDNWGTVKALADIGYDGYLSQESEGGGSGTPEEKARRGFDYMTKLLKAAGAQDGAGRG